MTRCFNVRESQTTVRKPSTLRPCSLCNGNTQTENKIAVRLTRKHSSQTSPIQTSFAMMFLAENRTLFMLGFSWQPMHFQNCHPSTCCNKVDKLLQNSFKQWHKHDCSINECQQTCRNCPVPTTPFPCCKTTSSFGKASISLCFSVLFHGAQAKFQNNFLSWKINIF